MPLMNTPKTVDLDITTKCNLRCKHCSHFSSDGDVSTDLATPEWLKFFEELNRCAVMDVCLCGGEPFCHPDLKELITGLVKNRLRFNILSNGTLITEDIAKFIAESKRCNSVQVSIDGSSPSTHDLLRGAGNFFKALEGIKNLRKHSISTAVRVTIFKGNVRELPEIARLLLEEIGLSGFSTNSASHMGLCRQNAELVQLSLEEEIIAMEVLTALNKKYQNRISASAGPLANVKHWRLMLESLKEGKPPLFGGGYLTSCGGVNSKLAVRADGAIIPCLQMPHLELGHINQDDLKELWQNHPELKKLRQRREIPLKNFEFCRDCEYINYCRGGCPALSYTITGEVYGPSPDACLRQFLTKGGRLPLVNTSN
ncbi:SynChlorMet cassette radical SAM/SPASM protein ScmE [Candidatus Saganbacteria bacterium CG08_land_8_20_14_0_20_45_16]|uniref:SynChlorMet cassette radical SAM/SPASM protein ScmE n=1 Tax=Candidatus Saganbacteria bacterium CG08_land_8_20_14_0_20_45_16 TaxID=2014293 RepID=A0A2H0XZT6_UNCSA|nr:MAG: SynChlorMet cassette radical SAM/SPASM protein ScmE [Candidatus Saganbacteria bacterium CG08_land_8_20_14_0_20_45_16]